MAGERVLAPATVARLSRLRLATRRRVQGRFVGAHPSRRFGSSLDFADYRPYVPGDDPRSVDRHAYARLGRLLVKLYEAEDEAALRVVVDCSASMGYAAKAAKAREVAAAFVAVAASGGDRARVILAGERVDAGPWLQGGTALPAAERRLLDASFAGVADLEAAVRRARGEGPRGPVVLVSDLLMGGWEEAVAALAGTDATCIHVLGRDDLEPSLDGDVRLVDAETGVELEIGADERALAAFASARDGWLAAVDRAAGTRGVALARMVADGADIEALLAVELARLGVITR